MHCQILFLVEFLKRGCFLRWRALPSSVCELNLSIDFAWITIQETKSSWIQEYALLINMRVCKSTHSSVNDYHGIKLISIFHWC